MEEQKVREIGEYFTETQLALQHVNREHLDCLSQLIFEAWRNDRFVFLIGNGGSATLATHFCDDLMMGTLDMRCCYESSKRKLKALSLTDNTDVITALGNDFGERSIFRRQLEVYASPEDLLIAISGSGNSENILAAVAYANNNRLVTFGLTGGGGGKLGELQQYGLVVPSHDMGIIQSVHCCLIHWVVDDLRRRAKQEGLE